MQTTIFQNKDYLLLRKPHSIPSTFGLQESFLDIIKQHLSDQTLTLTPLSEFLPADLLSYALSHLEGFEEIGDNEQLKELLSKQVDTFGQEQEYGLLNRLDNETAGFLYFAKTPEAFAHFKSLQKSGSIKKYYLAQINGKLSLQDKKMEDGK